MTPEYFYYASLLEEISFMQARHFQAVALEDGVRILPTKYTRHYQYSVFGVGALYFLGKKRARLKGIYVLPQHRGSGFGHTLTKGLIGRGLLHGVEVFEAHVFSTKWYEDNGFEIVKKFKTLDHGREFWKVKMDYYSHEGECEGEKET